MFSIMLTILLLDIAKKKRFNFQNVMAIKDFSAKLRFHLMTEVLFQPTILRTVLVKQKTSISRFRKTLNDFQLRHPILQSG